MELSIFVAKIYAVILLAVGVGGLGGQVNFKKVMDSLEKSEGLTIIAGYLAVFIGMILVQYHNFWVKDWTVLITIAGWGALIKGIMYVAFPKKMFEISRGMIKNEQTWNYVVIALGLVFGYFGFIA